MRCQRPVAGSNAAPSSCCACFEMPPSSMSSLPVETTSGRERGPSGDGGRDDQRKCVS